MLQRCLHRNTHTPPPLCPHFHSFSISHADDGWLFITFTFLMSFPHESLFITLIFEKEFPILMTFHVLLLLLGLTASTISLALLVQVSITQRQRKIWNTISKIQNKISIFGFEPFFQRVLSRPASLLSSPTWTTRSGGRRWRSTSTTTTSRRRRTLSINTPA